MTTDFTNPAGLLWEFRAILDAPTESQWFDALAAHARLMGFDAVLYATLPCQAASFENVWVRSNYPAAWRAHYDAENYAAIDPTVAHCMMQHLPLVWSPDIFASDRQQLLYREACSHGLRAGISLPAHGHGRFGMLCLVCGVAPDAHFLAHVAELLGRLSVLRDVVAQSASQFIASDPAAEASPLSPRETESLYWAAMGKTSKEIAALLHCAESTINFHLNNVRRKLDVPTRQAAVARAIQLGLIRRT